MSEHSDNPFVSVGATLADQENARHRAKEFARQWRVRFSTTDGFCTFVDIGSKDGAPFSKATAWTWGQREVDRSPDRYAGVSSVYSIDHENSHE